MLVILLGPFTHSMSHHTIEIHSAVYGSDGNLQRAVACFGQSPAVIYCHTTH